MQKMGGTRRREKRRELLEPVRGRVVYARSALTQESVRYPSPLVVRRKVGTAVSDDLLQLLHPWPPNSSPGCVLPLVVNISSVSALQLCTSRSLSSTPSQAPISGDRSVGLTHADSG